MIENVDIQKTVYKEEQFKKIVDTTFSQLGTDNPLITPDEQVDEPSIEDFFKLYTTLFYEIPKTGDINSHTYLINTSKDYIGGSEINQELQVLTREITELRQDNLELQQQITTLLNKE